VGKRPLGRPIHKWEDNTHIRMDIREIEWKIVDWMHVAEVRDH
jgi:hypothetical protein